MTTVLSSRLFLFLPVDSDLSGDNGEKDTPTSTKSAPSLVLEFSLLFADIDTLDNSKPELPFLWESVPGSSALKMDFRDVFGTELSADLLTFLGDFVVSALGLSMRSVALRGVV